MRPASYSVACAAAVTVLLALGTVSKRLHAPYPLMADATTEVLAATASVVKAFPSAEGFGAGARGGGGGRVIEVTTLDDAGQHVGGNRAPKHLSLHHNLYANLGSRTPLMQHAAGFEFANNVIYNWSGNNASVFGQFALNSSAFGNVVQNLWLAGPESGEPYLNVGNGGPVRIDGTAAEAGGTRLYLAGNWGPRAPTGSKNDWVGHGVNTWDYYEFKHDGSTHQVDPAQYSAARPFPVPPVRLDPVSKLLPKLLATVGASRPARDPIDQRIVQSVRDKTGTSGVNPNGPWPDLSTGAPPRGTAPGAVARSRSRQSAPPPPADSDHDGMPNAWEKARGLDPNNPRDGAMKAANGYTHVENYLNKLAGDRVP